ncbi:class I SAM-dependent methyltransferase [Microbacterium sp. 2FI]|uniref:class I SAM-dependent methyltransferase n=1 Tax=Microbacterium sp. 2FI TaxID=2502193 RepID=UPI0010F6DA99|nr:class I SAM-dependent methyltransferase [Microbacterium sp. 2FI]
MEDAAHFYTGLVADLYEPLRGGHSDPDDYEPLLRRYGEPALELGCGGGDPLVPLRQRGFEIEGVDSSADMLERCRRRAALAGVDVVLHHQRMEALDLPRSYALIYLAGATFNLLPGDDLAVAALRGIRAHLDPGGVAVIPLFEPTPENADQLGARRTGVDEHGAEISVTFVTQERDAEARLQRSKLRYERRGAGDPEVVEREWVLHWYEQERFRSLARVAGLEVMAVLDDDGDPAPADATEVIFHLQATGATQQ